MGKNKPQRRIGDKPMQPPRVVHIVPAGPAEMPVPAEGLAPDESTIEILGDKAMIRIRLHAELPSARFVDLGEKSIKVFNVPKDMTVHLVNGTKIVMKRATDRDTNIGLRDMLASFSDKRVRFSGRGVAIFLGPRDYK